VIKKAPARGLESAEAVGRNTNGATLARSLFTKRAIFWINPLGLECHPIRSKRRSSLIVASFRVWKRPLLVRRIF